MTPMLFDIGAGELMAIVLLAVVLFGPEKVPDLVKKTARVVKYLRDVANEATDTLKTQLGPEFADLTPADLNPKRLLERTVLKDAKADLEEIKAQVTGLTKDLEGQITPVKGDVDATLARARQGLAGIGRSLDDATSSLQQAVDSAGSPDLPAQDAA